MKRHLIAVSYHRLLLPIARYRSSHDVIVPRGVCPPVVALYGLAILHKAPKIYSQRVGTDEEQAVELCEVITLNIELDDRGRPSQSSGYKLGPTSCLVKPRCGVKSPSEVSQWLGLLQIDHPQDGSRPQVRRAVVEQDILVVPGGYSSEGHGGISPYAPGAPGCFSPNFTTVPSFSQTATLARSSDGVLSPRLETSTAPRRKGTPA